MSTSLFHAIPNCVTGALIALVLACNQGVTNAQVTGYVTCPAGTAFTPIAATGTTTPGTNADDSNNLVALPFPFPWLDGNTYTQVGLSTNGVLTIGNPPSSSSFCCAPLPIAVGGSGDAATPRISVFQEDLNPGSGGDIFTQVFMATMPNSVIFSWEAVNFWPSSGVVNAQVELFDDGAINLCWGIGDMALNTAAVGMEDDSVSLAFPATGAPFGANGITSTYPTNQCRCFQQAVVGGGGGDPHFQRWTQKYHDSFHGECDLVLVSTQNTHTKQKVAVHLRTTIRKNEYSLISTVGVAIGNHRIEIDSSAVKLNGKKLARETKFPITLVDGHEDTDSDDGHIITIRKIGKKIKGSRKRKKEYTIDWGTGSHIFVTVLDIFLYVEVVGNEADFDTSVGMMGEYGTGKMLDRQGNPMNMDDMTAYGMEWQVRPNEDVNVFSWDRSPQWPEESCRMPKFSIAETKARNLRSDPNLQKRAENACARARDFKVCVEDVVTTKNPGLAQTYF